MQARRGTALLLSCVLGLLLLTPARAQLRKYTTMKGFKVFEYYESIPGMKAQTNQVIGWKVSVVKIVPVSLRE